MFVLKLFKNVSIKFEKLPNYRWAILFLSPHVCEIKQNCEQLWSCRQRLIWFFIHLALNWDIIKCRFPVCFCKILFGHASFSETVTEQEGNVNLQKTTKVEQLQLSRAIEASLHKVKPFPTEAEKRWYRLLSASWSLNVLLLRHRRMISQLAFRRKGEVF